VRLIGGSFAGVQRINALAVLLPTYRKVGWSYGIIKRELYSWFGIKHFYAIGYASLAEPSDSPLAVWRSWRIKVSLWNFWKFLSSREGFNIYVSRGADFAVLDVRRKFGWA